MNSIKIHNEKQINQTKAKNIFENLKSDFIKKKIFSYMNKNS